MEEEKELGHNIVAGGHYSAYYTISNIYVCLNRKESVIWLSAITNNFDKLSFLYISFNVIWNLL